MLNIVIPMAGRGSRFAIAGYKDPKPLIPVGGKPMIQWVIENVRPVHAHRFIFICLAEHLVAYPVVSATLRRLCPGCEIVTVDRVTEGAACTVLLARRFIDNDEPLMIANSDQFVALPIDDYLMKMEKERADGLIMTFLSDHPKWSYCRMGEDGLVREVVEKQVVSNEATVGIYNFRRGRDYVEAADEMISRNLRVNNEFYVAPTYNELIAKGHKVVVVPTGREYDGMFGLGTPADLEFFLTTEHFARGRTDAPAIRDAPDLVKLSQLYARFFNGRNIAGLSAMFSEDFSLTDPSVSLHGRQAALNYIKTLYVKYPDLSFEPRKVIGDTSNSMIEFELVVGDRRLIGVDVIEWNGRRMEALRAYLYEAK